MKPLPEKFPALVPSARTVGRAVPGASFHCQKLAGGWRALLRSALLAAAVAARSGWAQAPASGAKSDGQKILEALAKGVSNAVKVNELTAKAAQANAADRPADALKFADEALTMDAGSEKALLERGRALRKLKRLDEAIAHLEKAVRRHPKSVPLRSEAAASYEDARQPRNAVPHYEALVRLQPNNADFQKKLAEARQAPPAAAPTPGQADALAQKAGTANSKNQFADALALAEAALQIDSRHELALAAKGIALRGLNRTDEALAFLEKAIAVRPESARLRNALGLTLERAQQRPRALEQFQEAARLAPKEPVYHYNVANVSRNLGDLARAEAEYQQALALNPKYANAHGGLGLVYLKQQRAREAVAALEEYLRLRPDDTETRASLAEARKLFAAQGSAPPATSVAAAPGVARPPAASAAPAAPAPAKVAVATPPVAPVDIAPPPRPRSATPRGPDTTLRPRVDRLGNEALAALRGLDDVGMSGEQPRFVASGEPRIIGQRAVAGGGTGVQVEWAGADADGRPTTLRAEVLLDGAGRVMGARRTGFVPAESLELAKLLEGWR